jgi:hypothetical protein
MCVHNIPGGGAQVSRGRKVKRHACSVIGTRQYGRMEGSCASAPLAKGPGNIEAAGKAEKRETNASNLFEASQAAEGRETDAPCRRKKAENMGTRETNVSEKEIASARRDGEPLTSASQERRQETAIAAKHLAQGSYLPRPRRRQSLETSYNQCAWTLAQAARWRKTGIGPIQRMPSEPRHHRQAQRAGMEQPAAAGARSPS